jgi:L-fuculose-phosphate aldolase
VLEVIKQNVVKVAKQAEEQGLCIWKSGNFSQRDKETGYVCITPSGVSRADLTPDHIIVVDLEGNIIEKKVNEVRPTVETDLHLEVYRNRDDLFGVAHTHSTFATTYAVKEMELRPIVFQALHFGMVAPVAPYGSPGTVDLAKSIDPLIKSYDTVLLAKHGVLCGAADLDTALLNAIYVEDVAKISYYATTIDGVAPTEIPMSEFETTNHAK